MTKPIFTTAEWTFDLINKVTEACEQIAVEELKLTYYPNQIEVISSDQMIDAYSSVGLPLMYPHWSFGKHYLQNKIPYQRGQMGLAYEIVINSVPTISYLMEENSMTMQTLVIAHACFGHNSFFKNNSFFREWTDAEGILDYLQFAKNYIQKCEERYGHSEVEAILDSCHALMAHGVDRYKRPSKLSALEEEKRQQQREIDIQKSLNDLWRTVPTKKEQSEYTEKRFPSHPEENILYFIEKYSPSLEIWQREIVRIVRKISQYFYPQKQTQVMNEGWATFTHYYIMTRLYEKGLITDGSYQEFLHSHTNVITQPPMSNSWNPYALGFAMFNDIKRICENPTDEDKEWFPHIAGSPWLETLHHAMQEYRDSSFIQQFLSPKLIRDFKMFSISDEQRRDYFEISHIQNERGYKQIRKNLSESYSISKREPDIQVYNVNLKGDRTLRLRHNVYNGITLGKYTEEVLKHVRSLWGYGVSLESVDAFNNAILASYELRSIN